MPYYRLYHFEGSRLVSAKEFHAQVMSRQLVIPDC
jgi:hypothetical protein